MDRQTAKPLVMVPESRSAGSTPAPPIKAKQKIGLLLTEIWFTPPWPDLTRRSAVRITPEVKCMVERWGRFELDPEDIRDLTAAQLLENQKAIFDSIELPLFIDMEQFYRVLVDEVRRTPLFDFVSVQPATAPLSQIFFLCTRRESLGESSLPSVDLDLLSEVAKATNMRVGNAKHYEDAIRKGFSEAMKLAVLNLKHAAVHDSVDCWDTSLRVASDLMYRKTCRVHPNVFLSNDVSLPPSFAPILRSITTEYVDEGEVLLVHRGDSFLDAALVWSPYVFSVTPYGKTISLRHSMRVVNADLVRCLTS